MPNPSPFNMAIPAFRSPRYRSVLPRAESPRTSSSVPFRSGGRSSILTNGGFVTRTSREFGRLPTVWIAASVSAWRISSLSGTFPMSTRESKDNDSRAAAQALGSISMPDIKSKPSAILWVVKESRSASNFVSRIALRNMPEPHAGSPIFRR